MERHVQASGCFYYFEDLPAELRLEVFGWLDRDSLRKCAAVCKSWENLASSASLWKMQFLNRAGNPLERYTDVASDMGWKNTLKHLDKLAHRRRCIECNGFPIDGVMWQCVLCDFGPEYGLCDDCHLAKPHDPTHILRKHHVKVCDRTSFCWDLIQTVAPEELIHTGSRCSGCAKVAIAGTRYQCSKCVDYSLCHTCFKTPHIRAGHSASHPLIRIKRPGIPGDDQMPDDSPALQNFPVGLRCIECQAPPCNGAMFCVTCRLAKPSAAPPHLCMTCAKSKHADHKLFKRSNARTHFASCDGKFCGGGSIVGVRYRCAVCNDFDLCEVCESIPESIGHHPHAFLRIVHQGMRRALQFYTTPRPVSALMAHEPSSCNAQ